MNEANHPADEQREEHAGQAMLSRALVRARLSLLWERLWPALASIATAAGLFLALSWLGLWVNLPPLGRAIGVLLFFVLAVAAAVPLAAVRWPNSIEGLRRLDRQSLMPHRPATAIADRMAPEAGDQFAVGPIHMSLRATLTPYGRWCSSSPPGRFSPPEAIASNGWLRHSTGTVLWHRPIIASTPGLRRRATPDARR